ncbi:MAG: hypothetical protein R6V55_08125 [Desulfovermiculus sp.]
MYQGLICLAASVLLALTAGCSTFSSSQSDAVDIATVDTNSTLSQASPAYDFEDIGVPSEMSLQNDESFIMQTPQVKAGTLVYTGWVDPLSLFDYYRDSMPQEGWKPLSYFKYGHFLFVFQKPDKVCVIRINKGRFSTRLEISVSPSMSSDDSVLSERALSP